MNNTKTGLRSGFTLVELLIVIAILGTLAVVVLVALNPAQQLARTRDAGRVSTVTQLGRAAEAFATNRNGVYPAENATWISGTTANPGLQNSGEIATVPAAIAYSIAGVAACTTNAQNGVCYNATTAGGGGPIVVFARLESQANNSRCTTAGQVAYVVYSSADGRGGTVCAAAEPTPGTQTFLP
jgi:prepilin-type N-terminal cleavage/methylation domain-containing protein